MKLYLVASSALALLSTSVYSQVSLFVCLQYNLIFLGGPVVYVADCFFDRRVHRSAVPNIICAHLMLKTRYCISCVSPHSQLIQYTTPLLIIIVSIITGVY